MTLKIIGAGFGRTGTSSLYSALNQLGYPCYHMVEVLENPANKTHLDFWVKVANDPPGTQQDWEAVFAGYTATVDNPTSCVWRELMVAYPEAKVILTTHPGGPEAWYRSTVNTVYFTETMWQFRLLAKLVPFFRKMGEMAGKLIWRRSHKNTMPDRDAAIALYQQHIQDVIDEVSPDRLLVFSVDQGWQPLCDFLGESVPETPFPNVNDSAEYQQRKRKVKLAAFAVIVFGVALVAGLGYGLARLL